jgi:phosphoglycolate phosphatase-like HAD superfamily hydrolase
VGAGAVVGGAGAGRASGLRPGIPPGCAISYALMLVKLWRRWARTRSDPRREHRGWPGRDPATDHRPLPDSSRSTSATAAATSPPASSWASCIAASRRPERTRDRTRSRTPGPPIPISEPTPRALRDAGLRVGIVSDSAWDLRVHLDHYGLSNLIDACVISYELGREKPDPQLFLKACADLGADPRADLMVGDNAIRDGGATTCGLRAYILPAEHRTGDRGLAEILRLIP